MAFWGYVLACSYVLLQVLVSGFKIDLLGALHLNQSTISRFPGIRFIQNKHEVAYEFGQKTSDLKINGKQNADFMERFNNGRDMTFHFRFKMHKTSIENVGTLISILTPKTRRTFFSMSLGVLEEDGSAIEGISSSKRYEAVLGIAYVSNGRSMKENIILGKNSTMEHWVRGMVRIKNRNHVTIYMNCRPLIQRELKGAIDKVPNVAELRITQSCEADFWTGVPRITKRLLATISVAEVLFGSEEFWNIKACPQQENNGKTEKGPIAGSLVAPEPVNSTCIYKGKRYEDGKVFYIQEKPCKSCSCVNGKVTCHAVICPKPVCRYGTVDAEGCCPICRETMCARQGKVFRFGCRQDCDHMDSNHQCDRSRFGCYCPRGMVENDQGKCIRPKDCTCKIKEHGKTKHYKMNTIFALDKCRYCACNRGKVRCLIYR